MTRLVAVQRWPGGAERRPDDAVDGEVEVGVVHDDDRVLAAELEVDVLQTLGGSLEHLHAGLARARERDHAHVRMPDEPLAHRSPTPVHDVDDAVQEHPPRREAP